jgi:hypothetical protein
MDCANTFTVEAKQLSLSLSAMPKTARYVDLSSSENLLHMEWGDIETGLEWKTDIPVDVTGQPVRISLNPNALYNFAMAATGDITIRWKNHRTPVLLESGSLQNITAVLMYVDHIDEDV